MKNKERFYPLLLKDDEIDTIIIGLSRNNMLEHNFLLENPDLEADQKENLLKRLDAEMDIVEELSKLRSQFYD